MNWDFVIRVFSPSITAAIRDLRFLNHDGKYKGQSSKPCHRKSSQKVDVPSQKGLYQLPGRSIKNYENTIKKVQLDNENLSG